MFNLNEKRFSLNNPRLSGGAELLFGVERDYTAHDTNGNCTYTCSPIVDVEFEMQELGSRQTDYGTEFYFRIRREGYVDRVLAVNVTVWQGGSDSMYLISLKK